MGRRATGGRRRWAQRVQKQARKEVVKLAESKRDYVFGENWITPGPLGIGDPGTDIFIANAFGHINAGIDDTSFTGNEILDPFLVMRLQVNVNYSLVAPAFTVIPTLRVSAYLIAVNDQFPTSVVPRLTSTAEDNLLFVKHPGAGTGTHLWQFNSQNVTVIKKKTVVFQGDDMASTFPIKSKTLKMTKRLRGKKEFEMSYTSGGVPSYTAYLKGWNYYYLVISGWTNSYTVAAPTNPVTVTTDRYVYFKDF